MYRKILGTISSFKNVNISPRGIRTIQSYIRSKGNDCNNRAQNESIELYDTIKDFTGVELEFYKDEKGNLMLEEITENGSRMIEFQEAESVANYLEHLSYLGINGKIDNKKINIVRDENSAEEKNVDFKTGERKVTLYKQNKYVLIDDQGKTVDNPSTETLKRDVSESLSNMSINDISRFSQFEYRKMIAAKYDGITLSDEEMEAIHYYQYIGDKEINGLLRGDLSFLKDEEKFFQNDLNNIIKKIQIINSVYDKFTATSDMQLLRVDSNVFDFIEGSKEQYDSFISTTGSYKFLYAPKDGVNGKALMKIMIPKGSHFIPMDLVSDRRMDLPINEGDNSGYGFKGKEECEILLPMSVLSVDKKELSGVQTAYISIEKQLDGIEILKNRIVEFKNKIIQYCGIEQYESIINSLDIQLQERKKNKEESLEITTNSQEKIKNMALRQNKRDIDAWTAKIKSSYNELKNPTRTNGVSK